MVPEIWCGQMGRQTDGWKKLHMEVGAPPKNKNSRKLSLELDSYFFVFPQKVRESLQRMPVMITYYSNKNLCKSMAIPLLKIT